MAENENEVQEVGDDLDHYILHITDEADNVHEFECAGEIAITFEGESEPTTYFIWTRETADDEVEYIITDRKGEPINASDEKEQAILDAFENAEDKNVN